MQGNPRQHDHISFAKAADTAAAFKHSGKERFVMMERTLNVDMTPWIKTRKMSAGRCTFVGSKETRGRFGRHYKRDSTHQLNLWAVSL